MAEFKKHFFKRLHTANANIAFDFAYDFFYDESIIAIPKFAFFNFLKSEAKEKLKEVDEFKNLLLTKDWILEKEIFVNFFCYFFYEISKRYFFKPVTKNWFFKNPYTFDTKIECDSIKRDYYYVFLKNIKRKKQHNTFLRNFLKLLK